MKEVYCLRKERFKGFGKAFEALFAQTQVQLCLVHLVRYSLASVSFKDRKPVAASLKIICQAATVQEAEQHLAEFAAAQDEQYLLIVKSWRNNWARVVPMFGYPPEIRRAIDTTNTIESLNMSLRKVIKSRGSFLSQEAAFKMLYLAMQNIQ